MVPATLRVATRPTSSALGPLAVKSASACSTAASTASGFTPGASVTSISAMLTFSKACTPPLTDTASFFVRTSSLYSRDDDPPASTVSATSVSTAARSSRPGTGQCSETRGVGTLSYRVSRRSVVQRGTGASRRFTSGPRLIGPKYFSTSGLAVAASISPASTSTALLGP